MLRRLLTAILLLCLLVGAAAAITPVIEGNTDATDPTTVSQQQAGTIQYLKGKVDKTLDDLGGNVDDLLSKLNDDLQTNSQNISDYQTATAHDTDPYSSGAYSKTGNVA